MMPAVPYTDFESKRIKLVPDNHISTNENTFTIIIGKNGIGKSKILSHIAKEYIYTHIPRYIQDPEHSLALELGPKLIAASTSPFDKFPTIPRRIDYSETNYRYIGMRSEGLYNTSSSVALLSSAAKGLLISAKKNGQNPQLLEVFSALGFYPSIELVFKPSFIKMKKRGFFLDEIEKDRPYIEEVSQLESIFDFSIEDKYIDHLSKMPPETLRKTINAIYKISDISNKRRAITINLNLEKDLYSNENIYESNETLEALLILLSNGFVRLMDILVHKISYGEMSLKRASSGEQCLTVLMLGIAGHITDGSIVLIDEPEISLHPKWQEIFMPLLIKAFSSFSGCQFIIATHSPQ